MKKQLKKLIKESYWLKVIGYWVLLITINSITNNLSAQTNYERDSLATSAEFQQRVKISSISAAKDILAATGTAEYLIKYCQLIISYPQGQQGWLQAMSYAVASAPAINFGSSDSDIQFTVNANIDKYAAAYYNIIVSTP